MTDAEILEKLRAHFQTKVENLNADEMAEGPFEDGTEFGDAWEAAAAVIDRRGGLRVRFEFGDAEAEARPSDGEQPAERDGQPPSVPHAAERVLGAKRAVIGWVWPDPVSPELYWCALHAANPAHVQSVPKQHHLSARDRAIAWVLGKDGNQLMAEEADRG